jgi:hypothetical protein
MFATFLGMGGMEWLFTFLIACFVLYQAGRTAAKAASNPLMKAAGKSALSQLLKR